MSLNYKPILFSTPMVQAILAGTKTQTRRIIKPQPIIDIDSGYKYWDNLMFDIHDDLFETLYLPEHAKYAIGDILWVRETFGIHEGSIQGSYGFQEGETIEYPPHFLDKNNVKRCITFKADYPKSSMKWKPSIFMPKEACRIFLKVKNIKAEKLQDISENDCIAEGVIPDLATDHYKGVYYTAYMTLWNKINGNNEWDKNPFVWVYEFNVLKILK